MRRGAQLVQARGQLVVVAPAAGVQHGHGRAGAERVDVAWLIRRAPSEPPNTSRQARPAPIPKLRAGRVAVGAAGARGHGRPTTRVALALAALDREGEEHALARSGASSRLVMPRWLSASVSTSGSRSERAASPTGPAT